MSESKLGQDNGISVRIAANFTIEPIEEFLAYWLGQLEIPAEIRFAPYNQVFQQLLEGGMLRANRGGINLVGLDLDAWLVEGSFDVAREQLQRTVGDLIGILQSSGAQGAGGAILLFPSGDHSDGQRAAATSAAKDAIIAACTTIQGWRALDLSAAVSRYSVAETRDPFTDELGNIPFTEAMYVVAATVAARWVRSVRFKPPKVIVLDCDNTLWQGVCGEGPVDVSGPYRKLHEFMLQQRDEGVLLAMASKNNEADVITVLESDQCVLKPEHFTAWQINWQPKSENLKALSEELGLALNSFLFLDDSPFECLEVRNSCPEVLAIPLPQEPEAIPTFLEHLWAFDRPAATEEDRHRASLYQAERQRVELSKQSPTREQFLASLQIEVRIERATESELPRVAQLTQRTTQFNMTGALHTVQSLTTKLAQAGSECWTVRVRDIFGDYGLVGVVVFDVVADGLRIDTLLLSCRALGRGVEDRMIESVKFRTAECGVEKVTIPFIPTARNRPALEFLGSLCELPSDTKEPFECVISASDNVSEWRASNTSAATHETLTASAVPQTIDRNESEFLARIASQFQSAAAVLAAIRNQMKRRPVDAGPYVAPKQGAEEALARIWSECLAVEPIGAKDNFFDFGGQSLIATRILTRVRAEFGVEMSLTNLFERPTIEEMAAYIVSAMSQGTDGNAVAAVQRR